MTGGPGADETTAEMIATVSHEIRAPLTTIKGFTKTLIDRWDRLDDTAKLDMLRAVNADADRVTRLLGELLDVSRLETGRLTIHRQALDLREIAVELVEAFADRSESHEIRLVDGAPVQLQADPDKVRQVMSNLIENATKYADPGLISVACVIDGDHGVVSVSDDGPGIPEDHRDGMFGKFVRRDDPGSPSGTGLGLYICKGLIEAHGGSIGVDDNDRAGSTFWFRLPLKAS